MIEWDIESLTNIKDEMGDLIRDVNDCLNKINQCHQSLQQCWKTGRANEYYAKYRTFSEDSKKLISNYATIYGNIELHILKLMKIDN